MKKDALARYVTGEKRFNLWLQVVLPLGVCLLLAVTVWLAVANATGREIPSSEVAETETV